MGRLIEILILKALALQAAGDAVPAEAALTKSMALAEPPGYLRIFLDEGLPMQQLLARWLAHAGASPLRDYAVRLLSHYNAESPRLAADLENDSAAGELIMAEVQPANKKLVEPLSQRELEVLDLMAQGRTNPEIGRQLVVAIGTVKAHAASIYRKLDVTNRTEAAARARQLGILP